MTIAYSPFGGIADGTHGNHFKSDFDRRGRAGNAAQGLVAFGAVPVVWFLLRGQLHDLHLANGNLAAWIVLLEGKVAWTKGFCKVQIFV